MSLKYSIEQDADKRSLSDSIKAEAQCLGFFACGIAKAEAVDAADADAYRCWIAGGGNAAMAYMENNIDKRFNPEQLFPGARSIVCVALNYTPAQRIPCSEYQIAAYAYGKDYHDIVKGKLRQLAAAINGMYGEEVCSAAYCDTAPILERYWAQKAGLGWIGRNRQLINPDLGSRLFLGELLVTVPLAYDHPIANRCGNCRKCIEACPTQAFDKTSGMIDCNRCLSYHTIENRGDIPQELHSAIGTCLYGCDRCTDACPWNSRGIPASEQLLQPSEELLGMTKDKWNDLTLEDYRRLFKGSAVKRVKYEGLKRNISIVKGNAL